MRPMKYVHKLSKAGTNLHYFELLAFDFTTFNQTYACCHSTVLSKDTALLLPACDQVPMRA